MNAPRPRTLLVAALGGQGGGVLTGWVVHAARAQGLQVQATSTPGVSQRTGATTYYLEIAAAPGTQPPVFGLVPIPGQVDVLLCSELLEAGRMIERGMCTPGRTTLIASTNRIYATQEKITGGDGRFDSARIEAAARELARKAVLFDMEALRGRHRAVISAAMFGALGGSGALGLSREACEAAIRDGGVGVDASLAAFDEAWQIASGAKPPTAPTPVAAAAALPALPAALEARAGALAAPVAEFARIGAAQALAYQDAAYAERYLARVERAVGAESDAGHPIAREAARSLALWMCYEDIAQVARLKARQSRLARIRGEAAARDDEVVRVHDIFKPRAEEIAAVMPRAIGAWIERRAHGKTSRSKGVTLQANSISGAIALRLLAALRPLRPMSLRFGREQEAIDAWLARLEAALRGGGAEAKRLAKLPRELKGYGNTYASGRERFERGMRGEAPPPAQARPTIWLTPR